MKKEQGGQRRDWPKTGKSKKHKNEDNGNEH
jgi:hypothetical protein